MWLVSAAKRRGLSDAGREKLRQAALANRPWEHSTGPKTIAGKAISSAKGRSRQIGPQSIRELRGELTEVHLLIGQMQAMRGDLAHR